LTEPLIPNVEVLEAPLALPTMYIKIIPHPHSLGSKTRIIPLDGTSLDTTSAHSMPAYVPHPTIRPWVPFCNQADFEYTETAVEGLMSKKLVDRQLVGIGGSWSKDSMHLTLCSWADMEHLLNAARHYSVKVGLYFMQQSKILLTVHAVHSRCSLGIISRGRTSVQVRVLGPMAMDS
jgi:hypothetical protein